MSIVDNAQACWTNEHWEKMSHLSLNQDQTIENHKLIRLQQQTTKENEQIKPWRKPLMQLRKIHVH
jgi:hypothetical protein